LAGRILPRDDEALQQNGVKISKNKKKEVIFIFENIPLITGRAAIIGLVALLVVQKIFKRPTVSIAAAVLAAGASSLF